jgi:4-amino-4-deoxy-L-arabinose transferase-like glycosyltransferase
MRTADDGNRSGRGGVARWAVLILLAVSVRGGVLLAVPDAVAGDPDDYRLLAENLLQHGVFGHGDVPTAYRPPLYPLILAATLALPIPDRLAVGLLHVGWGVATVVLARLLAERVARPRTATLAAVLVAVDPILLGQSARVMTETLAALLAAAALLALVEASRRKNAAAGAVAGAIIGLGALCRPVFLPLGVVAVFGLPWFASGARSRLRIAATCFAGLLLVMAPWIVRNQLALGRPIIGTTHGGYTLLLGNNPSFYAYLRGETENEVWDVRTWQRRRAGRAWEVAEASPAPSQGQESRDVAAITNQASPEVTADRALYAEAWENIARQPGMFAWATLVRLGRLWALAPHRAALGEGGWWAAAGWAIAVWYVGILVTGLLGLGRLCRRQAAEDDHSAAFEVVFWSLAWIVVVTLVHSLYWSNMRMRAPLVPAISVLAALGLAWAWAWVVGCKLFSGK